MDTIANKQSNIASILDAFEIRAVDLLTALPTLPPQIKVLSLDCFDTILFRKAFTPIDVFYDMQHKPHFEKHGITGFLRMISEGRARAATLASKDIKEVTLYDIYRAALPDISEQDLAALANDELQAEMESCYAFPAMIEVIRAAKKQGLEIIVVSDTYFNESELRKLLSHAFPEDAYNAIDRVFCSSDYGVGKGHSLFKHVLKNIGHPASALLHIGDNPHADYHPAKAQSMHAIHLYHSNKNITQLLRMQEMAASFLDGHIRDQRGYTCIYRPVLAQTKISLDQPANQIGYYALGQIMYSFAHFIREEVEALKQQGKKPKVLFLMRDAYLPYLATEAINGSPMGAKIKISRFASIASSLSCEKQIGRYLTLSFRSIEHEDLCKQLLLPKQIADKIIAKAKLAKDPNAALIELIKTPDIIQLIIDASSQYRARMIKHLEKEADIKPGDTLVFVDLGYTGTAQVQLTPVFKELGMDVVGRYLISLQSAGWKENRKGLLDSSWCDHRTMQTLVSYIALLEQLCTSNEASVVDYEEDGTPISSKSKVDAKQGMKNEPIHAACVQFIKDAERLFKENNIQFTPVMRRDVALGELGRLLFLPSEAELDYFLSFQFDVNMGTESILRIFDLNSGLEGLRKRGMFFMERNIKSFRTNYPAELRSAGAELVFTLLAGHRYGIGLLPDDMSYRKEKLELVIANDTQSFTTQVDAKYTYDGYYSATIPLGKGNMQIAILFGKLYKWLEIHSIDLINVDALFKTHESLGTMEGRDFTTTQDMHKHDGTLYECNNENSFLAYIPNHKKDFKLNTKLNFALRIIFRPTVRRNTPQLVTP